MAHDDNLVPSDQEFAIFLWVPLKTPFMDRTQWLRHLFFESILR